MQITAERCNGLCMLRITGELDTSVAEAFADHADAAVRAIPGPVRVDLSGVTFIDAHGARALTTVLQVWAAERRAAVGSCPSHVSRVLELLELPAGHLPAGDWDTAQSETFQLVGLVRRARLDGVAAKLDASRLLARVTDTCIRLSSTRERNGLVVEQGRRTVASSRAAREHVRRSWQAAAS